MEEIMQAIAQAEEQAAVLREEARSRAAQIAAQAEADGVALKKSAAVKAKNLRENGLRVADAAYRAALDKSAADARAYADEYAGKIEPIVKEVVRRICSGR